MCYNKAFANLHESCVLNPRSDNNRMERKIHQEPTFDMETLRQKADAWKNAGAKRVLVEWSTGTGPTVFYFPEGERHFGVKWTAAVRTDSYNELYADFIEHKLVPQVVEVIHSRGLATAVRCVDLQPLQVQRQRRRQIERAEASVAGHH